MKSRFTFAIAALALPSLAFASKVAIIDSGTDHQHGLLAKQYLVNEADSSADNSDNDGNGFVDDMLGWNFAEQNNHVIDYSYLGKFSPDVRLFFEIQTRTLEGTATEADKEWMKKKRQDAKFIKELSVFGNFAHGTHVAGIAAKGHPDSQVFAIKIIPTEVKLPFTVFLEKNGFFRSELDEASPIKEMLFKQGLNFLAKQQGSLLISVGQYTAAREADVANGSFGTSYAAIKPLIEQLYNAFFKEEERNPAKLDEMVNHFINSVVGEMTKFVAAAPKTLFVFAAGNDGTDNDKYPVSPANVRADNSISVAATLKGEKLAVFSNYGESMVDVAAPGVGIVSAIPGGSETMVMSGTSQAAPYVSNIAAEMKNQNPALKPYELKMLLMGTVDKKAWLEGKVKTAGLVNMKRAVVAASLTKTMDVHSAIAESRRTVRENILGRLASTVERKTGTKEEAMVMPLPSMFQ